MELFLLPKPFYCAKIELKGEEKTMQLNKDLRLRRVKEKNFIVAVNELSKNFYGMAKLNDTAAFVFKLLQNKKPIKAIVRKFVKKYGIDKETAQNDVESIIEQFKKAGFLDD